MGQVSRPVMLAAALVACSDSVSAPSPAPLCGEVACAAGEVCLGRACRKLCSSTAECPTGQVCERDACLPMPASPNAPLITSIDSNGSVDTASGHAPRHLFNRLIVNGERLADASITLTAGGVTRTLESCEPATATRLVLALPADLTAQTYTLTATNQAGSCSSNLSILQGEPGTLDASGGQIVASVNAALHEDPTLQLGGYAGANLLANPSFTVQTNLLPSFWTLTIDGTAAAKLVDVSADAPAGPLALENGAATRLTVTSSSRRYLNQRSTYLVEGTFRDATSGGTAGKIVLGVRLFDRGGVEIAGGGESGWWLEIANVTPPSSGWTRYSGTFGAGTARTFPAEAHTMTVSAMLNTDPSGIGNRLLRVQGLSLVEDTSRRVKPWFVAAGANGSTWVPGGAAVWVYVTGLTDVRGSAASSYNPANGRFTAPETGLYHCGVQAYKSFSAAGYHHSISTCFSPPAYAETPCNGFSGWDYTLGGQGSAGYGGYDDSTDRNSGLIYLSAGEQVGYRLYNDVANDYAYYRPYTRMYCAKLSD